MSEMKGALGLHGTFVPNKSQSIHRWYPYIEGFSNDFVSSLLTEFANKGHTVYDPFAGTGTTVCVAQKLGLKTTYSEINPFMRLVIEAKTNHAYNVVNDIEGLSSYFDEVINFSKQLKKLLVITRGEKGALAIHGEEVFECGIKKELNIIDLTGAGDLFAAGFLHGYINNLPLKESLQKGTEMSSQIIQKIGARLS